MTQTPGKVQVPGAEVVTQKAVAAQANRARSTKRPFRMLGAGVISAALVGIFALPAYASTNGSIGSAEEAEAVYAQALTTSELPEIAVPDQLPSAEEKPLPPPPPPVIAPAGKGKTAREFTALPSGVGSEGIVNAALAQNGMDKDCTDVAQDSLAAVGIVRSRFDGGPDLGVSSFARFGTVYEFSPEGLAPGDLLIYPGIPHVAVYVGGNKVLHGGWHPTTLASFVSNGVYPDYVVRVV